MAADPSAGRGARRGTLGRCCLSSSWGARGIPAAAVVDVEPNLQNSEKAERSSSSGRRDNISRYILIALVHRVQAQASAHACRLHDLNERINSRS